MSSLFDYTLLFYIIHLLNCILKMLSYLIIPVQIQVPLNQVLLLRNDSQLRASLRYIIKNIWPFLIEGSPNIRGSILSDLHANLSWSSSVGATSIALLLWQLSWVGSAPSLKRSEHTSALDLLAASCSGVKAHRSLAFTAAPCFRSASVTSK